MYDLNAIKSLPMEDVATYYGVNLKRKGSKLWGQLRNERTNSFIINIDKNYWYDFGNAKGGSNIDLVMELFNINMEDAIKRIAEDFNFTNEKQLGWCPLTESQYRKIDILPERVFMNLKFKRDHSMELIKSWEKKYGITVIEFAKKDPNNYEKMIERISLKNLKEKYEEYQFYKTLYQKHYFDSFASGMKKLYMEEIATEINEKAELIKRAFINNREDEINKLKVDYKKDIELIRLEEEPLRIFRERYHKTYREIEVFTKKELITLKELNFKLNEFKGKEKSEKIYSFEDIQTLQKNLKSKLEKSAVKSINNEINIDEIKKLRIFTLLTTCNLIIKEAQRRFDRSKEVEPHKKLIEKNFESPER